MNDTALDREIERVLAVDPSPEFAARVRQRIATEPVGALRRVHWAMYFAAGAVVAAAIAFAFVLRRPQPTPTDTFIPAHAFTSPVATSAPSLSPGFTRPSHAASRFSRTSTAKRETRPAILIDPREALTLRRLIAGVRAGRVDLNPVLRASTPNVMDLPPIADLVIAPLTIEPLAPIEGAEGVRQ